MSDNISVDPPHYDEVVDPTMLDRMRRKLRRVTVAAGVALAVGGVALLWWNEARVAGAVHALDQGGHQILEIASDKIDPQANGRLVHLTGPVTTGAPALDPVLGITDAGLLRLDRSVQMYQWVELPGAGFSSNPPASANGPPRRYVKRWEQTAIDSARFADPEGHANPPMPVGSASLDATDVRLGAYRVDPSLLDTATAFAPFTPPSEAVPGAGFHVDGDILYRGRDSDEPAIGDVRVLYTAVTAQPMTAIAVVSDDALVVARGGGLTRLVPGVMSAAEMLKEKAPLAPGVVWGMRGVGFAALWAGLWLVTGPAVSAAVAPAQRFVGVNGRVPTVALAMSLSLAVAALAWISHRLPIALALATAAAGISWLAPRLGGRRGAAR